MTGLVKLDNLINKIKANSLTCLNFIYKYLFDEVPNATKIKSPYLEKAL